MILKYYHTFLSPISNSLMPDLNTLKTCWILGKEGSHRTFTSSHLSPAVRSSGFSIVCLSLGIYNRIGTILFHPQLQHLPNSFVLFYFSTRNICDCFCSFSTHEFLNEAGGGEYSIHLMFWAYMSFLCLYCSPCQTAFIGRCRHLSSPNATDADMQMPPNSQCVWKKWQKEAARTINKAKRDETRGIINATKKPAAAEWRWGKRKHDSQSRCPGWLDGYEKRTNGKECSSWAEEGGQPCYQLLGVRLYSTPKYAWGFSTNCI